ncbi:MAG: transketolase [Leptospiraceae bacterium]|nr:transketolase [Leptospiraceae bacterium]
MASKLTDQQIQNKANEIRREVIRMVHAAACGHPGGPLGLADIYAVLFFDILNHRPKEPFFEGRDRLLISNGHVSAVRYAAMALSGYFPVEELLQFRQLGSRLQGHPSTRYMPEVENSSGSLGQGLSNAVGLSLGARQQKQTYRVFCAMSDGECGEGMTWEAAQAAVHHRAPVIAFLDNNGIQIDGYTKDVLDLGDLEKKFASFGWKTRRENGHDIAAIRSAFNDSLTYSDGPQMIVFDTILGKGVSFMENQPGWHGKAPNDELAEKALSEIAAAMAS